MQIAVTGKCAECVFAVVVTYLPQVQPLTMLLTLLAPQVKRVLVVDNSPQVDLRAESVCRDLGCSNVELIRLGCNLGIAKALNVGIEAAKSAGATHVLLSDQDSEPAPDMVKGLLRAEADLRRQVTRVGAIGSSFININSGKLFPFHVVVKGRPFYGRRSASVEEPHVEAITLITSGTLVPMATFDEVGLMREDFFIDCVDTEWCYRARAHGLPLYGTAWATMLHRMGDATLRFWFFGWIKGNVHSPLRIYYQIRNLVRLQFNGYRGIRWRIRIIWSFTAIFYCHVFYGDARRASLRMAMRGLCDGLRGRMGEFRP
ncbi:glycosyltransferase family 2 protein [Rhodanobacter koreensis]